MNHAVINTALRITAAAVRLQHRAVVRVLYPDICKAVHVKQYVRVETDVTKSIAPLFELQIKDAAANLAAIADTKAANTDAADTLASQILDPRAWDDELFNRIVPPLARGMVAAAKSQLKLMGVKPAKATTATDWVQSANPEGLEEVVFQTPTGTVGMHVATELPVWMQTAIQVRLQETFAQPYWQQVNNTTLGDVTTYLEQGLRDGWSIEKMAKEMQPSISPNEKYGKMRGRRIARTESGHALNGSRSDAIDGLSRELGPDLPIKRVWLSVLGNTTRDTHADLDGVPADANGEWSLGGVQCRWPADVSLPPGERCNCQCTVVSEFGMSDESAAEAIDEYNQRQEEDRQDDEDKPKEEEEHVVQVSREGVVISVNVPKPVQNESKVDYMKRCVEWSGDEEACALAWSEQ